MVFGSPSASDNCAVTSIQQIYGPANLSRVGLGVYTVIWAASDAAGNNNTCSFSINVTDHTLPLITCPASVNVPADLHSCNTSAVALNASSPSASDNCGSVSITVTGELSHYPVGVTSVVFVATDGSGNEQACTVVVNVTDTQPPALGIDFGSENRV